MDYLKIHDTFIEYIRNNTPKQRMMHRNSKDFRLNGDYIYTEDHHIIPRKCGGSNYIDNIVTVLPEEHIFLHKLRYVIFKNRIDLLAVRVSLNGFVNQNNPSKRFAYSPRLTKAILKGYSFVKQNSAEMRRNKGWHTQDGRDRISKARKGTMVAKDASTGVIIGAVDHLHPNILNGTWVHHTKGRKASVEERTKRRSSAGENNNNHSGLTDQYLIDRGLDFYKEYGYIGSNKRVYKFCMDRGLDFIKCAKSRFNSIGWDGFYQSIEKITGEVYNSYRRDDAARRKISESLKGKRKWITDGLYNKLILKTETIPEGWYEGRLDEHKN